MARFTGDAVPCDMLGEALSRFVTTLFLMNWPLMGGGPSSER